MESLSNMIPISYTKFLRYLKLIKIRIMHLEHNNLKIQD